MGASASLPLFPVALRAPEYASRSTIPWDTKASLERAHAAALRTWPSKTPGGVWSKRQGGRLVTASCCSIPEPIFVPEY